MFLTLYCLLLEYFFVLNKVFLFASTSRCDGPFKVSIIKFSTFTKSSNLSSHSLKYWECRLFRGESHPLEYRCECVILIKMQIPFVGFVAYFIRLVIDTSTSSTIIIHLNANGARNEKRKKTNPIKIQSTQPLMKLTVVCAGCWPVFPYQKASST